VKHRIVHVIKSVVYVFKRGLTRTPSE